MSKSSKNLRIARKRVHQRVRQKISGTAERPRLSVSFSEKHIRAQVIDDGAQRTLLGVCTTEKALKQFRPNIAGATEVGKVLAKRAKEKGVSEVVFDRGGFRYHGKVKALADAAREGGLRF
ncbi:MAG: 50S ribosomal protein L18 [bacterium]